MTRSDIHAYIYKVTNKYPSPLSVHTNTRTYVYNSVERQAVTPPPPLVATLCKHHEVFPIRFLFFPPPRRRYSLC